MANANDARDPLPSDLPASAPALNDVEAGAHDGAGSPTPSQTVVDRKNKKGGLTEGDDMLDDLPDNNLMLVMPWYVVDCGARPQHADPLPASPSFSSSRRWTRP